MELLKVRLDQFEGPLDLLLFLIQKHELDINSISLHRITDQYVQYVNLMREINVDVASEFLLMAATLIYLKSKRMLPHDGEDEALIEAGDLPTSEAEILRRLMQLKQYQEAGRQLLSRPRVGVDVFPRPNVPEPERQTIYKEMDLGGITLAFQEVLRRQRKRTKVIIRESISLPERIAELGRLLKVGEMTEFEKVLPAESTKSHIVVTFVALLELSRLKKLKVYQNESFGTLYITLTEELSDIDPKLMTGFQYNAHKEIHGTAAAAT